MTQDHPVQLEIASPDHFDRIQLVLRLAVTIVLGWIGLSGGWLAMLLYLMLPVAAAITISSSGRDAFVRDFAPQLWRVLRWLLELSAYMMLVTDRFPTADGDRVRAEIRFTSHATTASAIGRLVTSLPSTFALCVLSIPSWLLCVVAVLVVLVGAPMPAGILAFQRGVLRWQARLLAYHAALVDEYPPFALETDHRHGGGAAAPIAR
ncbi:MAG TPA: DUF4389 domain-containing protein [Kofleriaceae bacterium]|nr:DUF4389 domain-containing protein [Kofleriaceae bacterium]